MDSVDHDHEQKQLLTCIRASNSVGKRFLPRTQFLHGRDSFVPFEQPATKKTTRTIRHVLWRHELRTHLECCQQFGTTLKLSRLADVLISLLKRNHLRKFQFSCFCLNVLTFVSARVHGWYWPSRQVFFATNHEVVLSCRPQRRSCGSKVASNEIGQIFFSKNMMDLTNLMQSVLWKLWMELECPIKEPLKPLTLSWVAQSNYERCWFSGWKFCLARWDRQVWNFVEFTSRCRELGQGCCYTRGTWHWQAWYWKRYINEAEYIHQVLHTHEYH